MRLTKENIRKMLPGQTLTVICSDTPELTTAYETAKQTRRELESTDFPYSVAVSCSGKTMTVVVRVSEKKGESGNGGKG